MKRKEKSLPNPTNQNVDEEAFDDLIKYRGFQPIEEDNDAEPPTSDSAVQKQ